LLKNETMSRPHSTESVFRAIAHPVRRRVIELLTRRERSAGELAGTGGVTHPNLSQHLSTLRLTGVVTFRRQGRSLIYRLNPAALRTIAHWLTFVKAVG
jgi:DNA-binding transcriptional ArsR family regulator